MAPHDSSCQVVFSMDHSYRCETPKTALNAAPSNVEISRPLKKRVSFGELVKARKTLHINDFTDEEVNACWYDESEFRAIKTKSLQAASVLDDSEGECVRGLEFFSRHVAEARKEIRNAALWVVLNEQQLQWEEGSCDPEYIAEVYKIQSSLAQVKANIAGLNDRLDAMQ